MNPRDLDVRAASEALWDWNLVSNRIHFSPRWIALVGCEVHDVGGTLEAWLQRIHPEDRSQVSQTIEARLAEGADDFDIRHRMLHADGSYRWMQCHGVVQRNADGKAIRVMGSHADVTAGTVADSLTGLPNGLLLVEHLTRSLDRARRYPAFHFALLSIDLDRPARPDAPPGSTPADPLLTAAARRLETSLRVGYEPPLLRHNDVVARLEGNQFAILLDGLKDVGHAVVVAERILAELLAPFAVGHGEVFLSASIGIALSATGYSRPDEVLRDAQTALHRARQLGGGRCEVFDTATLKTVQTELQLETEFAGALERREFQLAYQPIVSLSSNQIVGFEALIRWQHPVLGTIPPLDFVPIAERTGFIVPLGHWILREACVQLKAWQVSVPSARDLWISVNLSGAQLEHPALVEQVGQALRDTALEPRGLVLELTESLAMENLTAVRTLLMRLRALGVRISIDDFGTGHSSLAYLRQLPVDALKVDRSFVRGIESNADMTEILDVVSTLAQQLGLSVVAEGVENEDQAIRVRSLHCEYGQGFLFSRPLDHDRATEVLTRGLPSRQALSPEIPGAAPVSTADPVLEPANGLRRGTRARSLYLAAAVATLLVFLGVKSLRSRVTEAPPVDAVVGQDIQLAAQPVEADRPAQATPQSAPAAAPTSARGGAAAPRTTPNPVPPAPAPASLAVVHLHRLGSCRGVLATSRDGIAFVPDEADGQPADAFSFKYGQFLHDLDGDILTIRSNDRTYRFKSGAARSVDEGADDFEHLIASITSFARLTSSR